MMENLCNLPMTQLENALKQCMELRPEIKKGILTSEELSDYISWMIQTYGKHTDITLQNIPFLIPGTDFAASASRILADPDDVQAFVSIASGYEYQAEEHFIPPSHDISVSRMLRYMPAHWHTADYFDVYYVFSGTCPIHFPNETILLHPGSLLIVAPSVMHASPCYFDDCVLAYYTVRSSTFQQVFWNQLPTDNLMYSFFRQALGGKMSTSYLHFETSGDEDILHLLLRIYQEYQEDELYSAQMSNALMSECFILLLRRYVGTARLPRTENFYWKHEFSAIINYIQTNFSAVSVEDVAKHFHYSRRQINRIVQNCLGISYARLVLKLRMEKAARLLKQRRLSIDAIAAAIGYSSSTSLYRAFTKYYGCPPGTYL